MKFYANEKDIVRQDQYGDPELEDRIILYYISDIHIDIFYSDRYSEYFIKDHYNLLPINDYDHYGEIKPTKENMEGFITAIFK